MFKRKPVKRAPKRPKRAVRAISISKLMQQADALFSKRVRANNADEEGICTCFTCGHRAPLKRVQCGHYVSRWYKAVRWHEDNARVQCWVCNIYKKGDAAVFRTKLAAEIGEKRVLAVERATGVSLKLTREYLTDLIEKLK